VARGSEVVESGLQACEAAPGAAVPARPGPGGRPRIKFGKLGVVRASRLVAILLLLQTRERMTAQELATRLEVSERTIYRDVQSLSAAGIPVYGEAGHEGGYRLVDGYRTRLTGLTAAEAESLFLTGLPTAAADLGFGEAMADAQLKLLAALPTGLREHADRLRERFHLDAPSWYHAARGESRRWSQS
jgi:predicted DNA-binding transcriptional regulator YafY